MRFTGRTLFVTGGASGIGAATARRFAAEGGSVAVVDRERDKAEEVARSLPSALGLGVDVASEPAVGEAVRRTAERFGRIDCVLNAAGYVIFQPLEEFPADAWMGILAAHVGGTLAACKHVLPIMRAQGGGSIVNISSTAALMAGKNNGPYAAAKGAIISFTRQLALDAGPAIRVNAIAPGRVLTGMTKPLYEKRAATPEEGLKQAAQINIMKRLGEPGEIAGPACFLFSDDASFITGTTLVVDGGQTAI